VWGKRKKKSGGENEGGESKEEEKYYRRMPEIGVEEENGVEVGDLVFITKQKVQFHLVRVNFR